MQVNLPAYAKTGFVILMNAVTKSVFTTISIGAPDGLIPAPIMPTKPATIMVITLSTLSQLNRSSVRGNAQISVGMAKTPVYSVRQSLFEDKAPRAI